MTTTMVATGDGLKPTDDEEEEISLPRPSSPPTEFKFFTVSNPAESKTKKNKRLVRSFVARTSHAKTRRAKLSLSQRVTQPQSESRPRHEGTQHVQSTNKRTATREGDLGSRDAKFGQLPKPCPGCRTCFELGRWKGASPASFLSASRVNEPFQCFGRPRSRWEQFLVDHYVTVVVPRRHSPCDHPPHQIDVSYYRVGMIVNWVAYALTDPEVTYGLCLIACRHLSSIFPRGSEESRAYTEAALRYRGELLRLVSKGINEQEPGVSNATILKSCSLALDEYMCGNLPNALKHLDAINRMIKMRGGDDCLGLNGFMVQMIRWFEVEIAPQVHLKYPCQGQLGNTALSSDWEWQVRFKTFFKQDC